MLKDLSFNGLGLQVLKLGIAIDLGHSCPSPPTQAPKTGAQHEWGAN